MQKLGILGGTFNPVHVGHLLIAETARDQLQLDRVIWVPARQPPHRSPLDLIDVAHRVEMVKQAIASHSAFILSLVDCGVSEGNCPTPSYAIDTLTALQNQHPDSQWYWILGLDTFQSLPQWYRRHELVNQCYWLVLPRFDRSESTAGITPVARVTAPNRQAVEACEAVVDTLRGQNLEVKWSLLQMPLVEISSSLIRQYRGDRRSIRYLVPDAVWNYITTHNLYESTL